jgi:uncharacterized protein (TIGR02996 family)
MTDRDALLVAIHATPDDDAPRLVFADWLDEHGEPERAEFIRLQVAQRREYEANGRTDVLEDLFVRARSLFYRAWSEPVRTIFGRGIAFYSRGFPKRPSYAVPADHLTAGLPVAATWIGPDTLIRVEPRVGRLGHLATMPELRWLRRLTIQPPWRNEPAPPEAEVADFLASPYLIGVRLLSLARLGLTAATGRALRTAPALRSLETLDLTGNQLGRAGALALARSRNLPSLRHLALTGNRIGTVAVRAFLKSEGLPALKFLDVSGTALSPELKRLMHERFPGPPPEGGPF